MRSQQRSVRIFLDSSPSDGQLALAPEEAHYLATVLRLRAGDAVTAFNGCGTEWSTRITGLTRRAGLLEVLDTVQPIAEPQLELTLVQAVVKSDAMDTIVQKATELGVTRIAPIVSEYCVVRLDGERITKRLAHWRRIARSACEQSGRHKTPEITTPVPLHEHLAQTGPLRILLDPTAQSQPRYEPPATARRVEMIIGPEGGFGPRDAAVIADSDARRMRFGPRILRADTAAITACAWAQERWGDLRTNSET
jgi:16S rRNA (uracil1498-N3)-methyltransferase